MHNLSHKPFSIQEESTEQADLKPRNELRVNLRLVVSTELKTAVPRPPSRLPAFVCDECALPLALYGANYIETYTRGRANVLRALCDLHAAEWEAQ